MINSWKSDDVMQKEIANRIAKIQAIISIFSSKAKIMEPSDTRLRY
jgi:hypothetical protein